MNKQIEEMAKLLQRVCSNTKICTSDCYTCGAAYLHNAGYRDEKETAREILQEFWNIQYGQTELDNVCIRLAEKYGVEVE